MAHVSSPSTPKAGIDWIGQAFAPFRSVWLEWPEDNPEPAGILCPYMLRLARQDRYDRITFVLVDACESRTAQDLTEASVRISHWSSVGR